MIYEKGMVLKKVRAGNDRTNIGMLITLAEKTANRGWITTETETGTYTESYLDANFELVTKRKVKGVKMSKYKVGDTVRIKKDLKEDKYCNEDSTCGYYTISGMVKLAGKTTKIKNVFSEGYELEIDNGIYYWTDGMFEDIKDSNKFEVGDIVCGNSSTRYGFTNNDMIKGEVLQVLDDGKFEVKILEHKNKSEIGNRYGCLEPEYFDFVSRVKTTKYPNEKFGFKIGETVLYHGEERKILAFDNRDYKDFYISGNYDYKPRFNDRPISETFEYAFGSEIEHLPVKEPVKTTKYKVGDIVKIGNHLCDMSYCMEDGSNSAWVNGSMKKFRGKSAEITKITLEGRYRIDLDGGTWYWVDGMFEGLAPILDTERFGFKIGEKVLCRDRVETILAFSNEEESESMYITGKCTIPPSGADRPIDNWFITYKDNLQHIPETPVAKVGMYVKVTKNVGGAPVGSICKITTVSNSDQVCYYYKKPDTERTNWYGSIDFSLELMPKDYKPMRVFTDDQITEAIKIIGRVSVSLASCGEFYYKTRFSGNTITVDIYTGGRSIIIKKGSAKASSSDTFNFTIGLMIALCRAAGYEYLIPKWVFNG